MPHGQTPMPPSRRQQDFSYNPSVPNMRSPPYMGYPPHMSGMNGMNGHMAPAYAPQQFQWYPPYGHMQQMPPRSFHPPYGPMIPRSSTPLQQAMSPQIQAPLPPALHEHPVLPPQQQAQQYPMPSPSPWGEPKAVTTEKPAFFAPVPWLSVPGQPFPAPVPRKPRRRTLTTVLEFPAKGGRWIIGPRKGEYVIGDGYKPVTAIPRPPSEPQTPTTSVPRSDANSTQPTTPSSTAKSHVQHTKPVIPVVPSAHGTPRRQTKDSASVTSDTPKSTVVADSETDNRSETPGTEEEKSTSPVRAAPKSWAELLRSKAAAKEASAPVVAESTTMPVQQNQTLADVLSNLGDDVAQYSDKVAFLEPRGLVNTGNMCYMNSVLQILVSCVPFHQFLDHVGRRAVHSFKSDVPLIDALIMFMREFRVIDAATSEDQLRMRLKPSELEQYGDAFVPEFVYDMIRQLPRFKDMRRGHQQDAQEFLGFLLEELHEECDRAAQHASKSKDPHDDDDQAAFDGSVDGWLEVGHKQKSAVTQSSGAISSESPVTRIFGGKLRSEFKVPGNKTSVTMEPYQPLQLDIGSPEVHNIIDALKGLTKPENIQGDFNSSRGPNYDSSTGATQKIWKKVGYPLDLEIPREVFPAHRRNAFMASGGLPKYRLMGVIYHHGKNASVGHYTVDVRRQDGREWIRMDDTVLRRVRSEDVAEAGGEEDPKVLAAALEHHKQDKNSRSNIFSHFDQDDMDSFDNDKGWSQVNGNGSTGHGTKKSVNGISSPSNSSGVRTPLGRYGSRDNRVAYLLFYQRMA
ncbi:hypothetical protein N7468_009927 [Penicillium chermesinum]|uniref:Ubiquitin carboxyl-terminal hydrolase n=1 Tax=Penicillium chermesinum TaxID=63820 RepID=A0A9W9TC15_9EURO|nr:uncharacterized protein N7468_009927 [Penicillium chermesinum]KAJ5216919.1 hypothetical protein N7468_009927 [Penicillium chermesinum]